MRIVDWITRIVVAIILLQTLFFKFTGHADSIHIFSTLGMEPWGRIGTGIVELIASVLILVPATAGIGAALALGTISGAIFFHLTKLGIVVNGDGGTLFIMAIIVFVCALVALFIHRKEVPILKRIF